MSARPTDTIAALATPPGRGGVGIIRVSGPLCRDIAERTLGLVPEPRVARFGSFMDGDQVLDQGISLFFKGPNSFTGEDVLELQGHGGPVVLDLLLGAVLKQGARLANPGEFTERAFLNDKIDLVQAEAIADLIEAQSAQAARSALRSLAGTFSDSVNAMVDQLTHLRMYVEAAIDFPDEDVDFLGDGKILTELDEIRNALDRIFRSARQGAVLREGKTVVLAGKPNAGKSSLLNALSGQERAIVTEHAGTTRDLLREEIVIDGLPLHVVDTAGLRDSDDPVERIGIARAVKVIEESDLVLLLIDASETVASDPEIHWESLNLQIPFPPRLLVIRNKIDLTGEAPGVQQEFGATVCRLSARTGPGVDDLRQLLKARMGFDSTVEGCFMARRRHLEALEDACGHVERARTHLLGSMAGELVAEELRLAQLALEVVTGRFSSDDLLGKIFSSFCIGK